MFFSMGQYNHMMRLAKEAGKPIEITCEQLEKTLKASGKSDSEVKLQMNISKVMGGEILIGDKIFKLKEEKKEKKNDKQAKKRRKKAS